ERTAPLGLEYARRGMKTVRESDPPALRYAALQVLASALGKNGKKEELEGVEGQLDRLFEEGSLPVKPARYKSGTGKGGRVVLVELFTGAQALPCVAADLAFTALLKTYPARAVVCVQYHLHDPRADPLANPDTLARARFYRDDIQGMPAFFVDG